MLTFHCDLSDWPQDGLPLQVGQRIHLVRSGGSADPYATHLKVLSADFDDIANARITVRLNPWQKWRVQMSHPNEVEWECPPFGRGQVLK